jgi:hypothetical protein
MCVDPSGFSRSPDRPALHYLLFALLLESEQLSTERGKAATGNLWHSRVVRVGNYVRQFRVPRPVQ